MVWTPVFIGVTTLYDTINLKSQAFQVPIIHLKTLKNVVDIYLKYLLYITTMIKLQRHQAYEKIKEAIVTLRLEMGKALNEQELCNQFDLGRTPVREALQLLESEGLVVIIPRKGVYVSYVSLDDFQKIYEARIMLETYCISEAVKKISDSEILRLKSLLHDALPLVEVMDIDGLLKVDREIHMGIVKSLENRYIEQIASQVYNLVTRTWFLSFKTRTKGELRHSLMAHEQILDKLATRDANEAQKANREHLDEFVKQIYKHLLPKSMTA
jgi:DNA-binding GntR family transcriptional regulator